MNLQILQLSTKNSILRLFKLHKNPETNFTNNACLQLNTNKLTLSLDQAGCSTCTRRTKYIIINFEKWRTKHLAENLLLMAENVSNSFCLVKDAVLIDIMSCTKREKHY